MTLISRVFLLETTFAGIVFTTSPKRKTAPANRSGVSRFGILRGQSGIVKSSHRIVKHEADLCYPGWTVLPCTCVRTFLRIVNRQASWTRPRNIMARPSFCGAMRPTWCSHALVRSTRQR